MLTMELIVVTWYNGANGETLHKAIPCQVLEGGFYMNSLQVTGIYKLTNISNGKIYIGQSKDIANRMKLHIKDSKRINDKRGDFPLYESMRRHGHEKFKLDIIEVCEVDELNEREMYYISLYNSTDKDVGYNQTKYSYAFQDPAIAEESHSPEIMAMHGKRIREWNLKQWKDPKYREMKSRASSELQKERLKNPVYLEEKTKQLKQATDKMKRRVGQYDKEGNLIAAFEGTREAERAMELSNDTIGKVCRGVKYRKTAKGYVWKYL